MTRISLLTLARLGFAALGRPRLLMALGRSAWAFRARGWYRRPPFLPVPPREYLKWRFHTAYGDSGEPRAQELERYLRWTVRFRTGKPIRPEASR